MQFMMKCFLVFCCIAAASLSSVASVPPPRPLAPTLTSSYSELANPIDAIDVDSSTHEVVAASSCEHTGRNRERICEKSGKISATVKCPKGEVLSELNCRITSRKFEFSAARIDSTGGKNRQGECWYRSKYFSCIRGTIIATAKCQKLCSGSSCGAKVSRNRRIHACTVLGDYKVSTRCPPGQVVSSFSCSTTNSSFRRHRSTSDPETLTKPECIYRMKVGSTGCRSSTIRVDATCMPDKCE